MRNHILHPFFTLLTFLLYNTKKYVTLCYNKGNDKMQSGGGYLDRQEFSMKLEELRRLEESGQYHKAYKVLKCIDRKKIKAVKDIFLVVDVLIENNQFDQGLETLIDLSKRLKSRRLLHQIVDVSIKSGKENVAKKYIKEFQKLSPNDPYLYVFRYQIAVLEDASIEKQIHILEELKQYEYMEKWAYELAKVYHRGNRDNDCINECNEIILWFGDGIYVEKAKVLKQYLLGATIPEELYHGHYEAQNQEEEEEKEEKTVDYEDSITFDTEESISKRSSRRPVYQSAFDFIEDQERQEQDREIDEIIKKAERKNKEEVSELEKLWNSNSEEMNQEAHQEEMAYVIETIQYEKEQEEVQENQEPTEQLLEEDVQKVDIPVENKREETDELIQKRRQRVTTKRLNDLVKQKLGEDADVINYLGTFARIHSVGEGIISSIEMLNKGNGKEILLIEGQDYECQTMFLHKLLKLFYKMNIINVTNIITISYDKFIKLNVNDYKEKLQNGCILITNLSRYNETDHFMDKLATLIDMNCFVLLSSQYEITSKVKTITEIAGKNVRMVAIHLETFTKEELIGLSNDFLKQKEYSLDEDAKEYFENYIETLISQGENNTFSKMMDIISKAYHCANERNKVELRNIAESGRYKDANFMCIEEKDFPIE